MNRRAGRHEEGTVLLSTLLVMSLMSAVALALLTTVRLSVTRTAALNAQAQIDLYAQGARDFALSQLTLVAGSGGAALNDQLTSGQPIVLPFENGSITLSVSDGSHCFRLSALSSAAGIGSDTAQQRFSALIRALGIDNGRADRIAAAAVDWVDADSQTRPGGAEDGTYLSRTDAQGGPHRTANVPMESVTELRAVDGMDEALFRLLLPHLCIGEAGTGTQFNIDTAASRNAPVLAAILGGGRAADQVAIELIGARPQGGYGSLDAVLAVPVMDGYDNPAAQTSAIVFEPIRIVAETIIRFGPAEEMQLLAYEGLDSGQPVLSYRAWGADEFPSVAWARLDAQEEPSP